MKRQFINKLFVLLVVMIPSLLPAQQKYTYGNQGAVAEIMMSAETKPADDNNLRFESFIRADDPNPGTCWYKISFNKDCFFEVTISPLQESDRYDVNLFRIEKNINYCEAYSSKLINTINYAKIQKNIKDSMNCVFTKKIISHPGDIVYIAINNIEGEGADIGHIIQLNTCDYSYELKTIKEIKRAPGTSEQGKRGFSAGEFDDRKASAYIHQNICGKEKNRPLASAINFGEKKIEINNKVVFNGEALRKPPGLEKALAVPPAKPVVVTKAPENETKKTETAVAEKSAPTGFQITNTKVGRDKTEKEKLVTIKAGTDEKQTIPVKCIVQDKAKKTFFKDVKPRIVDEKTGKAIEVIQVEGSSECEFNIEKGKKYKVECQVIGYKTYDYSIDISARLTGEDNQYIISLDRLKKGDHFVLKNIYFHANTPVIKVESGRELELMFFYLLNNPEVHIQINGHTNGNRFIWPDKQRTQMGGKWKFMGTAKRLSRHRAKEVRSYLLKKGISTNRIKSKGWGGAKPLYSNPRNMEQSGKNMRVEVVILKS